MAYAMNTNRRGVRQAPVPPVNPMAFALPSSLDSEQSVLGAMMLDQEHAEAAAIALAPDEFYAPAHRMIFESMLMLLERGSSVDLILVTEQLRQMDVLDNVGGSDALLFCTRITLPAHLTDHIAVIKQKAFLRRMLDAASQWYALVHTGYDDFTELREKMEDAYLLAAEGTQFASAAALGTVRAADLPPWRDEPVLYFSLYPGNAHLYVGESGAGKSSALYNVVLHAARNEPLWGIPFGLGRPARVLYIDPENAGNYRDPNPEKRSGGLCRMKMDRILGGEVAPPTLVFRDGLRMNLKLAAQRHALMRDIRRGIDGQPFDLVVMDTVGRVFEVVDENSNAEMGQISNQIHEMAHTTGAAIVGVHHTGKPPSTGRSNTSEALAGRGASALAGAMDVVLTWRSRGANGEDEDREYKGETHVSTDICQWLIGKDRPGQFGKRALYLRMGSPRIDVFERATVEDWREAGKSKDERAEAGQGRRSRDAEERVLDLVRNNPDASTGHILSELKAERYTERMIREALASLTKSGSLESQTRGQGGSRHYSLAGVAPPSSSTPNGAETGSLPHLDSFMAGVSPQPSQQPQPETESGAI